MEHLTRELLYGAIRTVIQISAGAVGWFVQARLEHLGMAIAVVLVFFSAVGHGAMRNATHTDRSRRFDSD